MSDNAVLSIEHLGVRLPAGADRPHALSDVSLSIASDEILCVVGESGSGKSMMANAIMRLLPNDVTIDGGRVMFEGRDLASASVAEMRPSEPRLGDGCIAVTDPPSGDGTLAQVMWQMTPQWGTPSVYGSGRQENCMPSMPVTVPSGARRMISVSAGMFGSCPAAAFPASASVSIASLSRGESRRA